MEVRIGVVHTQKEMSLELAGDVDDVVASIEEALSGEASVVWLTDTKGRRVGIPAGRLAYIEIDDGVAKQVGFGR